MKNQLTILVGVACAIALAFLEAPDRGRMISVTHAADLFGGQQAMEAECTTRDWCNHANYPDGQVSCAVGVPAGTPCINRVNITITAGNRKTCWSPVPPPEHDCTTSGVYTCKQVQTCMTFEGVCVVNPNGGSSVQTMPETCTNLPAG